MNKTKNYDFTIIVPVFNEQDNVPQLEKRLGDYIGRCKMKACVLMVDDGSKDSSMGRIKEACGRNKDFHYIHLETNSGLSTALKAGIDNVYSPFLGYIDADLQTAPEDFDLLLDAIGNSDMAIGIRVDRKDSGFKKLQSKIANGFRRMMTGDDAKDTGCPLKVIRTDVAKQIPFFKGMHRFLPALVMLQQGNGYVQVPVRHFPRTAGESKYHLWNRLWGPFCDCFAFRWMKKRYIRYSISSASLTSDKDQEIFTCEN
ncbi:MAG: glycosyltransferase family 2 protein [Candidatus Cryptobacteroides sp.]